MKQKIYISLFAILYLIVAFSSFWHAVSFFGLANNLWMSIILAFAFEVGQAAVLFSLLTSSKDRSRIMPWVLMTMFTLVQVIGNVFSSYKYIISNSVENLRYFKEPIFIWTTIPDDQATVIVTYVEGAILPIAALLLTSMITNYLSDKEEKHKELEYKKPIESKITDERAKEPSNNDNEQWETGRTENTKNSEDKEDSMQYEQKNNDSKEDETEKEDNNIEKEDNEISNENIDLSKEESVVEELNESVIQDESIKNDITSDSPEVDKDNDKKESHFINLK